jgi:phosphoribosylformylglycinamidine synthase
VIREHNLTDDEYARIEALLARAPTFAELGIFSALWSEHCSYKHSRSILKTFPTEGPQVVQGPGKTPACSACPTAGPSRSRSNRTTIRPR